MGGHSQRRSTSGALPGAGLPAKGTMVHVKFPAPSKIQHQVSKKVILGTMTSEQAEETITKAKKIIRASQTKIYSAVDKAGGVRARREDGEVVGDVPMGTFALPEESAGVAQVVWSQAATAQRQLAALGIGGIQYTAPAQYVSASGDGHIARTLSPEASVKIGRRVGMWRTNLAMLSIDLPHNHPNRRAFYRAYDAITENTGAQVKRFGHSAYVGHPSDIRRVQRMASDMGIEFRS